MDKQKREIAFSNRHLYYYASLLRRLYGFILYREKHDDERYIGRFDQPPKRKDLPAEFIPPDALKPRRQGDPAAGEVILFRYRKRLLLGYCQHVLPRAISEIAVIAEDHRRLRFHRTNLVYLTAVTVGDEPSRLQAYAASIRKLSEDIDLRDIWELAREAQSALARDDIADLYWKNPIDATRWAALCLHLDQACPYFTAQSPDIFLPVAPEEADKRIRARSRRRQRREEYDEFVHWMRDPADTDVATLTASQQTWQEDVRQFALWGSEADHAASARDLLQEICPGKKDLKRAAFDLLVSKGIWKEDENLDLHRADIPTAFSEEALREAGAINLKNSLKGRKKRRKHLVVIRGDGLPEIALSFQRALFGGPEFGIHIPDLSALIAPESALDRIAQTRLMAIDLPDRSLPLFPPDLLETMRFTPGRPLPALSLIWRMNRKGRLQSFAVAQSTVAVQDALSPNEIDRAYHTRSHAHHRAIRFFAQLTQRLAEHRSTRAPEADLPDLRVQYTDGHFQIRTAPDTLAHRIVCELEILAAVAIGRRCIEQHIPAIFETRDPVENADALVRIAHPVVRRHEIARAMPPVRYSAQPAYHHGLGVAVCCPITRPKARYADLLMQRQIVHMLRHGTPHDTAERLDLLRYRMQEIHALASGLAHRRTRDLILRHWADRAECECPATVLHIKQRGVLVECRDVPFKTVVYPGRPVALGEELTLHLTGVDTWLSQAHFTVIQNDLQVRP